MVPRSSLVVIILTLALFVPKLAPASPSAAPAPRLESTWKVSMVFTVAQGLRDREVGQRVSETWVLLPRCGNGPCNVELRRAGRKLLLRQAGTTYTGKGSFTGPFSCNGQTHANGTTYVESWTVRVRKSGPGQRGRRALKISGIGATVGRSGGSLPCDVVVSRERVELSGLPLRP